MSKPFDISAVAVGDKQIEIWGPHDLMLYVDFDDVDHGYVLTATQKIVEILNENWKEV